MDLVASAGEAVARPTWAWAAFVPGDLGRVSVAPGRRSTRSAGPCRPSGPDQNGQLAEANEVLPAAFSKQTMFETCRPASNERTEKRCRTFTLI